MKKLALNVVKALFAIVLFTTVTITLSASGVKTVSEAKAAVSIDAVVFYLESHGYTIVNLREETGGDDWIAHTILNEQHYTTTVFVKGCEIVGSEDIAF